MPSPLQDRIRVKTSTLGFSAIELGDPVDGYESFNLLGSGVFNIYYGITTGLEWEYGQGIYNSEDNSIARNSIIASSNNNSHVSLFDTSIVYLSSENDNKFLYTSNGVPPESGYFVTGNGVRFTTQKINSSDVENALGYSPYDSNNPKSYISLDNLPETILYDTGVYYDPEWISYLNPDKVDKNSPLWNAAKIQGYKISDVQPFPEQVLGWNVYTNQWEPKNVSESYVGSSGIIVSGSNIYMGGTGTLDELNFTAPVKIRSVGSDIIIGQNAASDNGYSNNNSISIGTDAGSNSSYLGNIFIGQFAGTNAGGGANIGIGAGAAFNSIGSFNIYIGDGAGTAANASHSIELGTYSNTTRIATDNDIHIQDVIGGNTSTRRLSFGDIVMAPDANVHVISTESTTVPFIAKGAVYQTANIIEARASDDSILFYIDNSGYISTPSSGLATWNANQLQSYPIQTGHIPSSGQFLYYDGSGWMPENISIAPSISTNYIDFKPQQNPPTYEEGRVFYDKDSATLAYYNNKNGVTLNIGQENYLYVKNLNAISGILNGQVVYIDGAAGKIPTANLAIASNYSKSQVVGVATMDIPLNGYGYITTQGIVHDINTFGYTAGSPIFLSVSQSGNFTSVEPLPPNYPVKVGTVLNVHNSQGSILVEPISHYVDGDQIVGDIYVRNSGNLFTGNVMLNGAISGTLSNTNLTTIDSTPYSSGDCVKYIVKAKYGTAVQASEILITSDGTDSYMTEYGLIYTSGLLADISTSYSSSNIVLSAKATNSNTSIRIFKTLIS